ncbi:biotin--[acetyl-CoA-carboxylase] ligase [Candidatus Dependentiae bacterium]|nr:biotin--[acetyl-CoA-carboxylase] ligase [Candidatus Dependentiae bacterium]
MSKIGSIIIRQKECLTSSMDWAKEQLEAVSDGTVFLASRYCTARGSNGRVWCLYPGQLVITFVLKPKIHLVNDVTGQLNYLNMSLTVGVAKALERYEATIKIKKPNDFIINNKKVGGILIELVWCDSEMIGVVVGIAINCNNEFDVRDPLCEIATSLKCVVGTDIEIDSLQQDMLESMSRWYDCWQRHDFMPIAHEFQAFLGMTNRSF